MSLSDRLQQARRQRLIAAGFLTAEPALRPEPEPEPEEAPVHAAGPGLFGPITIEVPATGLHLVPDEPVDLTDVPDGVVTSPCPNCTALGHLDMVDLVGHTMHLTCPTCGTMWQVRQVVGETAAG